MSVKNIYGLSEGVYNACLFCGLKFPSEVKQTGEEHSPSDYFGDDFELDSVLMMKLRSERRLSQNAFDKQYKLFKNKYFSQKSFKHTKTNLNVYFVDFLLFSEKLLNASFENYFDFEFYRKSFAIQNTFGTAGSVVRTQIICNNINTRALLNDKSRTNEFFSNFLYRDWIYTRKCTFAEFKNFINKHSQFICKPIDGSVGKGVELVVVKPDKSMEVFFEELKRKNVLLEEVISQHEDVRAFCPTSINTIRVYSLLDVHNVVHILATSGKFGRTGNVIDNFRGGGFAAVIDPKTGVITSDGVNANHERVQKHPDTGKIFKGFQYPSWKNVCKTVKLMAKMIPQMRHVAWDIAISDKKENNGVVLVEANGNFPGLGSQQTPDDTGRLYLYTPFLEEIQSYNQRKMEFLGYRVNNVGNFATSYDPMVSRNDKRLQFTIGKLISDCTSLIDLGCRKNKPVKSLCPQNVKYYPVDYIKHDDEVIAWDFVKNNLPPPPCGC